MNFDWSKYFNAEMIEKLIRIGIILIVGIVIITIITAAVKKLLPKKIKHHETR